MTDGYKDRDGTSMTTRLAAVRDQFDNPSRVAFGRGLLVSTARGVPDRMFAPRVERAQVVVP